MDETPPVSGWVSIASPSSTDFDVTQITSRYIYIGFYLDYKLSAPPPPVPLPLCNKRVLSVFHVMSANPKTAVSKTRIYLPFNDLTFTKGGARGQNIDNKIKISHRINYKLISHFLDGETSMTLSPNYPTMKSALVNHKESAMKLIT